MRRQIFLGVSAIIGPGTLGPPNRTCSNGKMLGLDLNDGSSTLPVLTQGNKVVLTEADYVSILNRYEYDFETLIRHCLRQLEGKKILITGASGSLGTQLMDTFDEFDIAYTGFDIVPSETHDVVIADIMNGYHLSGERVNVSKYSHIFHFAADKHAPVGEATPQSTIDINIKGTENLLYFSSGKIVFSSTCKAIAPETVYGASKLIGERLMLNAGHSVARYYNVVESAGNVFEIWDETPPQDHYVTDCYRYFITARESLALTLFAAIADGGRWAVDVHSPSYMPHVYEALYGGSVPVHRPRRGDRVAEPRAGKNETLEKVMFVPGIVRVDNYHDA